MSAETASSEASANSTRRLSRPGTSRLVLAGAAAIALLAAACGGDDGDADEASAGQDEEAEDGHEDHEHGEEVEQVVAREDRCDIGFNTATFNETSPQTEPMVHDDTGEGHEVDFTIEELAEVFVDPDNPMTGDDTTTPEEFAAALKDDPVREAEVLSGGMTHSLAPDNWLPMTDSDECEELADELERTRQVAEKYPTAQDALDAGYFHVTPYLPAIAAHYINPAYTGEFDIDNPAMLLYDGDGPDAQVVGVSHYITSDEEPDADFTGPNDHWHRHVGLCLRPHEGNVMVAGATTLTEDQCAARGGSKNNGESSYMNHVWIVPGCESDYGLFSGANPAIVFRGADVEDPYLPDRTDPIPSGCGSGKTLEGETDFDEGGSGPTLR